MLQNWRPENYRLERRKNFGGSAMSQIVLASVSIAGLDEFRAKYVEKLIVVGVLTTAALCAFAIQYLPNGQT